MFWKKKLDLPVTKEDKNWVEENITFLEEKIGERQAKIRTVLPTHPYFKSALEGTVPDVRVLLNVIMKLMNIEGVNIQVELFSTGSVKTKEGRILTTPADINGRWQSAAGMYQNENDVTTIFIAKDQLKNSEALIATIAHELSHQLLLGEHWINENDEYLTDLLAIVYGLGIFLGNSKFNFSSEQIGLNNTWKMSKQGYLPDQVIAYTMAYLSLKRGESISYVTFLDKTIAKYFKQSIKYLKKNDFRFFDSGSSKEINAFPEVEDISIRFKEDVTEEQLQKEPTDSGEFTIDDITGLETVSIAEACSQEDIPLVKHLLQIGVEVNTTSTLGFSALNVAVVKSHIELIKILLDAGADINFQNKEAFGLGETPLASAIKKNNESVIKLLLEYGADPTISNSFHKTPLMIAAKENAIEAAKILIENKAPIEQGTHTGFYAETPLCIAVLNNHSDMATLLIQNGAKTKPLRKLPRHKINPKMVKWLKQRKYL